MSHLTITGNATADPDFKHSQAGNGWVTFTVAENQGKDKPTTFQRCKAFDSRDPNHGQLASNIAETITKGTRVIVSGRIVTEEWETNGEKRSANVLIVDSIGPDLRWATARVARNSAQTTSAAQASNDPWGADASVPF